MNRTLKIVGRWIFTPSRRLSLAAIITSAATACFFTLCWMHGLTSEGGEPAGPHAATFALLTAAAAANHILEFRKGGLPAPRRRP